MVGEPRPHASGETGGVILVIPTVTSDRWSRRCQCRSGDFTDERGLFVDVERRGPSALIVSGGAISGWRASAGSDSGGATPMLPVDVRVRHLDLGARAAARLGRGFAAHGFEVVRDHVGLLRAGGVVLQQEVAADLGKLVRRAVAGAAALREDFRRRLAGIEIGLRPAPARRPQPQAPTPGWRRRWVDARS